MELILANVVQNDCPECLTALLEEAKSLTGLQIGGEFVRIPKHWLNHGCSHGRAGLRFEPETTDAGTVLQEVERAKSGDIELENNYSSIDATKNIGYPVREYGSYGSHPIHDDFGDESGPDGSGTY